MAMYVNGTLIVDSNAYAQAALGGLKTIQGTSIIGASSNSHYPKSVSSYQDSYNTIGSVAVARVPTQTGGLAANATVSGSDLRNYGSTGGLYTPFYPYVYSGSGTIAMYTTASGSWRVLQPCYWTTAGREVSLPVVRIS